MLLLLAISTESFRSKSEVNLCIFYKWNEIWLRWEFEVGRRRLYVASVTVLLKWLLIEENILLIRVTNYALQALSETLLIDTLYELCWTLKRLNNFQSSPSFSRQNIMSIVDQENRFTNLTNPRKAANKWRRRRSMIMKKKQITCRRIAAYEKLYWNDELVKMFLYSVEFVMLLFNFFFLLISSNSIHKFWWFMERRRERFIWGSGRKAVLCARNGACCVKAFWLSIYLISILRL